MSIIAVDDEKFALMDLQSAIEAAVNGAKIACFGTPRMALEYAKSYKVDIAFLDIEMSGMTGIQLAKRLKDINGKTNIIFVTGYSQYALDAFALHASGYIMKPVTKKAILDAVEHLHNPVSEDVDVQQGKKLRVQTFGNFEVFANDKPLVFTRSKTKEFFAYLIDRQGAKCTNDEIAAVIWEDAEDTPSLKSLFRTLVADLTKTLNDAGFGDVIIKQRGQLAVAKDKISCDLYDFSTGKNVNSYMGEYMSQYSWAEFTNAYLERMQAL